MSDPSILARNFAARTGRALALLISVLALTTSATAASELMVSSPNGELQVTVWEEAGEIRYRIDSAQAPLVRSSRIGLEFHSAQQDSAFVPAWSIDPEASRQRGVDEQWPPVFGKRSVVRNHYNELTVSATTDQYPGLSTRVIFRAYDDGVAFRQVIRHESAPVQKGEGLRLERCLSTMDFVEDLDWWSYRREQAPIQGLDPMMYPVYADAPSGQTVVVTEGHLRDIAPMTLGHGATELQIESGSEFELPGPFYSLPWRVIMVGDTAGQLIDSDLIVNLNPKADPAEFAWLKPGVSLWDWRAFGFKDPDGLTYGQDKESWTRFIDFAAETDVPYVILDANWYGPEHEEDSDPINGGQAAVVRELIRYGAEKGVGLILYLNHVGAMRDGIEDIMAAYQQWGAKGIKYGFMKMTGAEQTQRVHEVTRLAEKYELMINFHDGPLPPTGEEAYMPGMVNREFCHAQMDARRNFSPSDFLGMVHVNMITGPLDMNNGMFDLDEAHVMRSRVAEQIDSTLTAEAARTLITYGGGWTVIPDAPGSYREHPELFRFISAQQMPWAESQTLDSQMGEYISMMRQTGDTYLVGSVTNESARSLEIDLSFLPAGQKFKATIFADTSETHYLENRLAYQIGERTVDAKTSISAELAPGSGHCMIIEPL
ncbi:glycoside hydrolase family 97 catalytic domain-containing protein [Opitutaceae bacterium]|nr:glycoside hydrolase family 97 catalytic domain-containing protein [Opitutaceae bacterium]